MVDYDKILCTEIEEMDKIDFRIRKQKFDSLPMTYKEYFEWKHKNLDLIKNEEFIRAVLSEHQPTTLRAVIRILDKFAKCDLSISKSVIFNILNNDRFIRAEIRLKSDKGKLDLDLDKTLLYLAKSPTVDRNTNTCYR